MALKPGRDGAFARVSLRNIPLRLAGNPASGLLRTQQIIPELVKRVISSPADLLVAGQ